MFEKIKKKIVDNSKRLRILAYSLALFSIVLFFVFNLHGFLNIYLFSEKQKDIKTKIELEKRKNDSLKAEIELIKSDKFTIEKIAREKYGFVKPGERIYFINNSENK
jgi:cell division protein FtsB